MESGNCKEKNTLAWTNIYTKRQVIKSQIMDYATVNKTCFFSALSTRRAQRELTI